MSLIHTHEKNTILIVDDDPMQRLLISEALKSDDYQIYQAENGEEAVALFKKHKPILVILDVYMPIMDGFETCQAIRNEDGGQYTAILIATSLEDDASINRAYEVGATDFITKPINWTIMKYRARYSIRGTENIEHLHTSQQKNQAILSALPDIMICFDQKGICLDYHCAQNIDNNFECEVGKPLSDSLPMMIANLFQENMIELYKTHEARSFEYHIAEIDTQKYYETRLVLNGNHALAIIRDITENKVAEQKLKYIAYYDQLTKLPNSLHIKETIDKRLTVKADEPFSIIFINLDRFKYINDTYGHTTGDQILQMVVARLKQCFSHCAFLKNVGRNKVEIFSRFSGDEFVILLADNDPINTASKLAQKIIGSLSSSFKIDSKELYVTPSIGISIYPQDGQNVDCLLKNSDSAVHHSKKDGGNTFTFYTNKMNEDSHERIILESDLRKALDNNQFEMYYQPQVNIESQQISGVEALIRWHHPEKGMISPVTFIPMAEEIGLIEEIGHWVLKESCAQMYAWLNKGISLKSISVNLSAKQFRNKNLLQSIKDVLKESNLPPHYLDIELTESMIMYEEEKAIQILHELKSLGIKLALDDFGTGYSSLSYLKSFPIDYLKIDRAFVTNLDKDPIDAKIVNAIITMAHALQLEVIAEGVETKIHFEKLKSQNCDIIQGYLFSKPLNATDFENFYLQFQQKDQFNEKTG